MNHEALRTSVGGVVLQPVDIAIAFLAARHDRHGGWAPKRIREDLGVPWSSINLSLGRLTEAGVLRGGRISRQALATLLPALQYLVPARPGDDPVMGVPTGASSPGLDGQLVVPMPMVWACEHGTTRGQPVAPLFRTIPESALANPELHTLYGAIDAARTGRARELRLARKVLGELVRLPEPMAA
jgi:hypothetical protein